MFLFIVSMLLIKHTAVCPNNKLHEAAGIELSIEAIVLPLAIIFSTRTM